MALVTGILRNLPGAMAPRADLRHLEDAVGDYFLARSAALRASLRVSAGFRSASLADGAGIIARHSDHLLSAMIGFLEARRNCNLKVATAGRGALPCTLLLSSPTLGTEQVDSKVAEDVFEITTSEAVVSQPFENRVEIRTLVQVLVCVLLIDPRVPMLVV